MEFAFTAEQHQFQDMVSRFLESRSPTTAVRQLMATTEGYDPHIWRALTGELGLAAVAIPERYGGAGFGAVELAIVLEEMGRALLCAPYFSTCVLAATAILEQGTEAQKEALLPDLAAGSTLATLAFMEADGSRDLEAVAATATPDGDRYRLAGEKWFVLDGLIADRLLVAARKPDSSGRDGLGLFMVEGSAAGLVRTPLATMDATRKQARVALDGVVAVPIGDPTGAAPALERTLEYAAVMLANEMVGGAARLQESAVDYAGLRMQFGRPIGSFQAVKHLCADMLMDVELARSAARHAAWVAAEQPQGMAEAAALAKGLAADAYLRVAANTIQIHGGIGFTWDNDTHLWFKRAKSSEVFLGDPAWHRERLIRVLEAG
jgi:alkylation response protein AidB-like acyl-CoA dehydrogenase